MANDMTYDQIAATLNEINQQVTGETSIAPVNTSEFITVAQTLLKTGYDPVMQAISQIMHKTIYSARNFDPKVDFLRVYVEKCLAVKRRSRQKSVVDNALYRVGVNAVFRVE